MTTTRTPFGFSSTAAEVLAGVDLSGIRAVVTGASSGIGLETARALHWAGAEVTLAVRDVEAGQRLVASGTFRINTRGPDVRRLDLSDLHSVKAFVDAWTGPLHVLVNNAGIMATPQLERTNDGFELQFATNYFGHFALTIGLMQALNPGAIATSLQKHTGGLRTPEARRKSVEQGAATSVLLAASPYLHGDGGHYFEDCNEAAIVAQRTADFSGVAAYALDLKNAMRLWD
jgi:hypothetical protein